MNLKSKVNGVQLRPLLSLVSLHPLILAIYVRVPCLTSLLRGRTMMLWTHGPWYLNGRQFGLILGSQRPLGKLSSFYSFLCFIITLFCPFSYTLVFFFIFLVYFISHMLHISSTWPGVVHDCIDSWSLPSYLILFSFISYLLALPLEFKIVV